MQRANVSLNANSDPTGYSFENYHTQHVVYFDDGGNPQELRWSDSGWHQGSYELSNPFPDNLGMLASPFFYESVGKDHTFFVEPFVIGTAVNEWTEWIVTTKEYVVELPVVDVVLIPLIPETMATKSFVPRI